MRIIDIITYTANEFHNNYILERTMIDAGKDIAKGAFIGAGMGLLLNVALLKHNGLPKSMLKYIKK